MGKRLPNPEPHQPLSCVSGALIYKVLNERDGGSWNDACRALERELVEGGWTPPEDHPLRALV
jgi:hypothetical protein